jgi:putative ABC transport system substrate-binding protein
VGSGLVASLAKPGGNTTGVSNQAEDAATKYIELAREALPQARRLALLFNAGNTSNTRQFELMRGFARDRGMAVEPFGIRAPEELEQAFGSIARYRPDALVMVADSMLFDVHRRIAAFALKEMLPTIAPTPEHGEAGMLFAYGASRPEMYRRAAVYVKKILSGAKPADLPVEQPTRLELVVNLKTAAALRLKVPHGILLRADRVIE